MEECFDDLDAPIGRVAGPNIPIPFSPPLEAFATPKADDVVGAVRQVLKELTRVRGGLHASSSLAVSSRWP